ncbi:MAG TPA: hypothetical protein VIS07_19505 [Candidatus Binatia bacterium]
MQASREHWSCQAIPGGPPGFPYAILSGDEVLAWVKRSSDAAFITVARDEVRQLALELRERDKRDRRATRPAK